MEVKNYPFLTHLVTNLVVVMQNFWYSMKLFVYFKDTIGQNLPPFFGLAKKPVITPGILQSVIPMKFFSSMADLVV